MRRYTYTDRNAGPVIGTAYGLRTFSPTCGRPFPIHAGEVRFICEAESIVEADEKLLAATGLIAMKEPGLCCAFEDIP